MRTRKDRVEAPQRGLDRVFCIQHRVCIMFLEEGQTFRMFLGLLELRLQLFQFSITPAQLCKFIEQLRLRFSFIPHVPPLCSRTTNRNILYFQNYCSADCRKKFSPGRYSSGYSRVHQSGPSRNKHRKWTVLLEQVKLGYPNGFTTLDRDDSWM